MPIFRCRLALKHVQLSAVASPTLSTLDFALYKKVEACKQMKTPWALRCQVPKCNSYIPAGKTRDMIFFRMQMECDLRINYINQLPYP